MISDIIKDWQRNAAKVRDKETKRREDLGKIGRFVEDSVSRIVFSLAIIALLAYQILLPLYGLYCLITK